MKLKTENILKVKPAFTIVVTMDQHALGKATILGGGLILPIMLYFGEPAIQEGLLNKGRMVYLRVYTNNEAKRSHIL